MNTPPALTHMPAAKRALLDQLVDQLRQVPGIAAIVLGGSYASGTQHAISDLDVGLYYFEHSPFAIDAIRQIATRLSADGNPTVTDFYQWGRGLMAAPGSTPARGRSIFSTVISTSCSARLPTPNRASPITTTRSSRPTVSTV